MRGLKVAILTAAAAWAAPAMAGDDAFRQAVNYVFSGNVEGKTQTATLRVDDAYQFAYGNYAPAYGIALVLAAMAVLVLVAMTLVKPREEAT